MRASWYRRAARWLTFWHGTLWLLYQAARPVRPPRPHASDFKAWEAEGSTTWGS